MPRPPSARKPPRIPRLHWQAGYWYWKPEKKLRPHWRSAPLGRDDAMARAEARRLNAQVAVWLKTERPVTAPRRAQPRTVGELIELWRHGPMKEKAPRTQKQYAYELKRLHDEFGHEPAATLDTIRVDDWADTLRRRAPSTLRVVSGRARSIFQWAARKGYVPKGHNPFREMNVPGGKRRKFRFGWPDVLHIVAVAEAEGVPSLGHALAVCFLTVQRITDVLALEAAAIMREGGEASLRFRQSKTGFDVDQQWPDELDRLLGLGPHAGTRTAAQGTRPPRGATRDAPATDRPLIVSERSGRRWDEKYASRVFARVVAAAVARDPRAWAHLAGGQLRDGRRSGFVHGVLGGATVEIMCSLSGHSIKEGYEIVEHYLPKTRAAADKARAFMTVG